MYDIKLSLKLSYLKFIQITLAGSDSKLSICNKQMIHLQTFQLIQIIDFVQNLSVF